MKRGLIFEYKHYPTCYHACSRMIYMYHTWASYLTVVCFHCLISEIYILAISTLLGCCDGFVKIDITT